MRPGDKLGTMIVSDKHKYVYVEVPRTGSTAISKELIEKYDGHKMLYKHANYKEFLRVASPEQKKYFVFAGVRNPLDEVVSLYLKFLTNHHNAFTDKKQSIEGGGWVSQKRRNIYKFVQETKSYEKFLKKYYNRVYTSNINVNAKHCDMVMKFENLDEDFAKVLKEIGIKKVRRLPVANKTKKKGDYTKYYKGNVASLAVSIFGPFMNEWGYSFPKGVKNVVVPKKSTASYRINRVLRTVYANYVKSGPLQRPLRFVRNILE